jgi:DNA primase
VQLRRKGSRFHGKCLFHADDTPSLVVYPATQSFYCFGCLAWGDVLNLHHFLATGSLR